MIVTNISHILQLLTHLQDKLIEADQKQVDEDSFKEYFEIKKTPIGAEYPDYFESKKFCLNAKLVEEKNYFLYLTILGENILKNSNSIDVVSEIIIKKCLTNDYFSNILIPLLKQFHTGEQNEFWLEKNKVHKLFKQTKIVEILWNIQFLKDSDEDEKIFINSIYSKNKLFLHSVRKNKLKPKSQSELEDDLLKQKRIGEIAEKFVLDFEKERLRKDGCIEKSNNVEQISQKWATAGYDIESFNGEESDDILPDRFIEVKGTSRKEFSIFWSANEIEIAKYHGSKYWIYFVSEIDIITGVPDGKEPEMIPNAYDRIKPDDQNSINDEYFKTTNKIHVTKND